MSVELVVAIAAGLVSVIGSIGALITALRTAEKVDIDAVEKRHKLDEIHVLVDGRLSEALKEIAALRKYIGDDAAGEKKGGSSSVPGSSPGNFDPGAKEGSAPADPVLAIHPGEEVKIEGTVKIKP